MKLYELIKDLKVVSVYGKTDMDICDIKSDSNSVSKGSLYICISGQDFDGHDYIKDAETYGAVAVITEKKIQTCLTQIVVENSRKAMSIVAGNFYGHADKKMKLIGVLGTNGKTTTAHFITSVLTSAGINCGLIGTLGTFYGDKYLEPSLTTPDPLDLHKILADMYESGVETVIMEVSAHAVYLDKTYGLEFEQAIFTNFTQDHLDFFKTMENYENAKLKFFKENKCKYIITNSDDETGLKISNTVKNCITYGIDNPSDIFALEIKYFENSTEYILNLFDCIYEVKLNLIGKFNVYNSLAAATSSALYGITVDKTVNGLENLKGVSGRLENVYSGDFSVFLDYAHTPDSLQKALLTLKENCEKRLICVFGCGGNRDSDKRPVMGKISGEIADFTVITSDNPRFEEPMDIINQIEKGLISVTRNYVLVQNREEGIEYAINLAEKGDTVLIAGKGGERYQDVLGIKRLYNDKDCVERILKSKCIKK